MAGDVLDPIELPHEVTAHSKQSCRQAARGDEVGEDATRYVRGTAGRVSALWQAVRLQVDGDAPHIALGTIQRIAIQAREHAAALPRLPQGHSLRPLPEHPTDGGEGKGVGYQSERKV